MNHASLPPVSWSSRAQLDGPGIEPNEMLQPPNPQSSAASHSSVVNDYGDAEHLAENRPNRVSTGELVVHSGALFPNPDTSDLPEPSESDLSIQTEGTPLDEIYNDTSDNQAIEKDLGQAIRARFQQSANGREEKTFLPIDALEKTIIQASIRRELHNTLPHPPAERLEGLIAQIWEATTAPFSKAPRKTTSRRKIFAILALLEKTGDILGFIKENIYDNDLPFILKDGPQPGTRRLVRKGSDIELLGIAPFRDWSAHQLEAFDNFQWMFLAPYFRLSTKEKPKINHYVLENRSILPFIEDNGDKREGGFSDVWKVKIHPAHHNYCEDSVRIHSDWISENFEMLNKI